MPLVEISRNSFSKDVIGFYESRMLTTDGSIVSIADETRIRSRDLVPWANLR